MKELPTEAGTATQVLDVAERLAQTRGFNGFSYADVAVELKLSKAALHYHFASKADLGEALIARYSEHFGGALDALDAGAESARTKLEGYVALYEGVLRDERMCLCGMLAAEHETLPEAMRDAVVAFFDFNEVWLSNVLEQGKREGDLQFEDSAIVRARILMGGLEGALLVARPYGDVSRFHQIAKHLIRDLEALPPTGRSG